MGMCCLKSFMHWGCYCCVHLEQFCVSLQIAPDPYLIFCFIWAVCYYFNGRKNIGAEISFVFAEHIVLLSTKFHDI